MTVTTRRKHSFSRQHLSAAKFFASACKEMEDTLTELDATQASIHRSYVTGAILSAQAALEASINELYKEAYDKQKDPLDGLTDAEMTSLTEVWNQYSRVTTKYQEALAVKNARFDENSSPYKDVDQLVRLRNALVHYNPEWEDEDGIHQDLENNLQGEFRPNPYSSPAALWFPHQCLGAGCAEWAVDAAEQFMTEFCNKMNIRYRFG